MTTDDPKALFTRELDAFQNNLYAFILSLIVDPEESKDVLQETNIVLWSKAEQYISGTDFSAWACRVAYYQVLAFRRDKVRDRHLFDDRLLASLAEKAETRSVSENSRHQALEFCLDKLSPEHRELIRERYQTNASLQSLASTQGRTVRATESVLYRIRQSLLKCVTRKLTGEIN